MQEVLEKIIEKLEERTSFLSDCTKYGNKDAEQQNKSYSTMMMYEVADLIDDLIEIIKQEAEKHEECYKDCGECEAYNKEKHHCPKFCKVIKETVKEIEANHNDWISCSERLPKYGEVVMCSCTNSGITISCITHKGVKPSKSVRFGQHSVIAWQQLPQLFQPKGE